MGTPDLRHARARLGRTLAAVLGVVLVVPPLAAMPAQAEQAGQERLALADPAIQPSTIGAGSITSLPPSLDCNGNIGATTLTPTLCEDKLSLSELTSLLGALTAVTLVPQAQPGWDFKEWFQCPTGGLAGDNCVVPLSALGTALNPSDVTPTAVFDPICDPLPANPLCTDTTAPNTEIVTKPALTTAETTATFTYKAVEADQSATPGATFECQLTPEGQNAPAFTTCTSPTTYGPLEPGKYTFAVRASDAAQNVDPSPATYTWTITATGAPQTSVAERPGRWLLARATTISLFASDASSYTCTLDNRTVGCGGGLAVLRKLASSTHQFSGAAVNEAGQADPTPARVVFTVPVNNTSLKHVRGFAKKRGSGHFLNTYSLAKRQGATLTGAAKNIKRVSLVVTRGKGYGTVKVFLGKSLLKKVSLASSRAQGKRVVDIATFSKRRKGTIRIVTTSRKPVVIEGLGIASR